jgi:hypothetical protein
MRRIAVMLLAALMIAALPAAAFAQANDEEIAAAVALLKEKVDALDGADAAAWADALDEVETALAALKAIAPDLDYAELDAAIAALGTAIDGGDLDAMTAAGEAVAAAFAGVEAEAEAGAGDGGDGTAEPGAVDTGDAVNYSPNAALLGVAIILALLASGALALRWSVNRR